MAARLDSNVVNVIEDFEREVNRFLDEVVAKAPPELREVLFGVRQSSLAKAILADLLDVVPFVGDAANLMRVREAAKLGEEQPRRLTAQLIDLLLGAAPEPLGGLLDLLTPTNTIGYLRERMDGTK